MLGVLTALEVVALLHSRNRRLPQAIEVIGFADEEGTRFGITLLGSKGIPWQVRLSLDVRGPQDEPLDALLTELLAQAHSIGVRRGVGFDSEEFYRIPATACDPQCQQRWHDAVMQVQGSSLMLPSGAGHDAIAIAARWPVGMLFVRCAGGSAIILMRP